MPIHQCLCQAPQQGFGHPGIRAAAVCLCCQIPPPGFWGSCTCFQLALIPASCQCRWQPFPHCRVSLRAKTNSILLLYVCEFSCRHLCFFPVWGVGYLYVGRKHDITYMSPELCILYTEMKLGGEWLTFRSSIFHSRELCQDSVNNFIY